MFEKSIAALRTAFPDRRVAVAFIGGNIEERNAFGRRGLINFQGVERLNIETGEGFIERLYNALNGRTLAGAVLFGLDPSVADQMHSIQNAVSTAANLLGCSTQDLIHDEYVAQNSTKVNPPLVGFFRHTDGGMYEVLMTANSSADVSPVVVYKHWWPFLPSVWTRPLSEWHDRFTPITVEEYGDAVFAMSVEEGREMVTARRKTRKLLTSAKVDIAPQSVIKDVPPNKLGSVVEQLESISVRVGHHLYDAKGNRWTVLGEGEGSFAFHLALSQFVSADVHPPLFWHANQFTAQGVQQLYWDNPIEGLTFDWAPYAAGTIRGFRCTIRESEFRVDLLEVGLWAVTDDVHFSPFSTANKAMRAVESHLESKWSK